ncbi:MAG TPA: DUF4864 domain-containing protein [Burkholderiaceae bacterium]|nr:DUF4864 domain-containing protein [Burkholderiaceae bacterium]
MPAISREHGGDPDPDRRRALLRTVALASCPSMGWLTAGVAQAADVPAADAKAVRAVIEAQLAALAVDDAKRAFSYATPALRRQFGSPENFIEMVRVGYPVVYRHASVAFLKPQRLGGELVQGVHLSDENGTLWLALYRLQRQKDKSWRISGCQLVQAEGRVT